MNITLIIIVFFLLDVFLFCYSCHLDRLIGQELHKIGNTDRHDKHTANCQPEKLIAPCSPPYHHHLQEDGSMLRSSVYRNFRYNQSAVNRYVIEYDALCHTTIDRLLEGGWTITLETDVAGNLFYAVQGNRVKA